MTFPSKMLATGIFSLLQIFGRSLYNQNYLLLVLTIREKLTVIINCRFEDDKQISGLFEEVWEDITSGERVTLQLFLQEIVNHICESITSSSWASKKKARYYLSSLY